MLTGDSQNTTSCFLRQYSVTLQLEYLFKRNAVVSSMHISKCQWALLKGPLMSASKGAIC